MSASRNADQSAGTPDGAWERIQRELRSALREIRFGSLEIVIHDSRVVQIERRQKVRFTADAGERG